MAKNEEKLESDVSVEEVAETEETPVSGEVIEGEVVESKVVDEESSDESEVDAGEPGEPEGPEAQLQAIEAKLEEAEELAQDYLGGWQRAQATFENYRKRMQKEREEWRNTSNARLLGKLLPILDDFDRAFSMMPESLKDDAWFSGIKLIQRKIQSILETENAKPMDAESGDNFDPKYHQAVLHQETEDFEDGQIMTVVEKGYILGKRVLRPAMVVVAKAPPEVGDDELIECEDESAADAVADESETGGEPSSETEA